MLNKTNYIHLRHVNAEGQISNHGGLTIAYQQLADNEFLVGVAKCHERDNFCKRLGRVKAEGRMKSDKLSHTIIAHSKTFLITQVSDFYLF